MLVDSRNIVMDNDFVPNAVTSALKLLGAQFFMIWHRNHCVDFCFLVTFEFERRWTRGQTVISHSIRGGQDDVTELTLMTWDPTCNTDRSFRIHCNGN